MKRTLLIWLMSVAGYLLGRYGYRSGPIVIGPPVLGDDLIISGSSCAGCREVTWWFFEAPQVCPQCGRRM